MTVSITNNSKMPFTVSLYHDSYCAVSDRCECKRVATQAAIPGAGGASVLQHQVRRIPASLDVAPGATVRGLPDAVLKVPQVARARKGNPARIKVVVSPTAAPAPKKPAAKSSARQAPSSAGASTSDSDATAGGEGRSRRRQVAPSPKSRS